MKTQSAIRSCIVLALGAALTLSVDAGEPTPAEVFTQRIEPIFKSPKPSSCMACHLAGVDLKDFILPDAESTFRSLRDQRLIDLADPEFFSQAFNRSTTEYAPSDLTVVPFNCSPEGVTGTIKK